MRGAGWFVLLGAALLALGPSAQAAAQDAERVVVTNFPEVQRVSGTVVVSQPIPQTAPQRFEAIVSPGALADPSSYTEAGLLDATGFGAASLSLMGTLQGRIAADAPVGALLLPDVPEAVAAFRQHGIAPFALRVQAQASATESGIFHAEPAHVELAFPRYRVLLYDTTPRTAEVVLYVYLKGSR